MHKKEPGLKSQSPLKLADKTNFKRCFNAQALFINTVFLATRSLVPQKCPGHLKLDQRLVGKFPLYLG